MNRNIRIFSVLALAVVCLIAGAVAQQSATQAKPKKIDLNTANQAELESLKGIGPSLAQKIIAARPFKSVADLKNVSGIGLATYDDIKGQVTVRAPKASQAAETASTAKTKATTTTAAETASAGHLVNINTADKAALEALPGVGPALADKIIAARPFKSVDDLKNVSGLGDAKFNALKDLVTVKTPRTVHPAVSQAPAAATSSTTAAPKAKAHETATGPVTDRA